MLSFRPLNLTLFFIDMNLAGFTLEVTVQWDFETSVTVSRHGVTSQKTSTFSVTAVKTLDLPQMYVTFTVTWGGWNQACNLLVYDALWTDNLLPTARESSLSLFFRGRMLPWRCEHGSSNVGNLMSVDTIYPTRLWSSSRTLWTSESQKRFAVCRTAWLDST